MGHSCQEGEFFPICYSMIIQYDTVMSNEKEERVWFRGRGITLPMNLLNVSIATFR